MAPPLSLFLAQTAYEPTRTSGLTTWSRVRSDPGYCAHLCLPAIDAVVGAELLVCPRRYSGLSVLRASRPLLAELLTRLDRPLLADSNYSRSRQSGIGLPLGARSRSTSSILRLPTK